MKTRFVPALILRLLVYCVVILLALLALVPGSFDILHLIGTGDIPLHELWGGAGEVKRPPPRPPRPADAWVQDLGNGTYRLAKMRFSDAYSGPELSSQLHAQARRLCAAQMGQPHVTQSGEYSSKGLNQADIEFRCEKGLPAAPVHVVAAPVPPLPALPGTTPNAPTAPAAIVRLAVRFNSPGGGPDAAAIKATQAFLAREESVLGHAVQHRIRHWGREGEFTMCFALDEFDRAGQARFIHDLRSSLLGTAYTDLLENVRCQ